MRKIAGFSILSGLAFAAMLIWTKSPSFTTEAQVIERTAPPISPDELLRQIDVWRLPTQQGEDAI